MVSSALSSPISALYLVAFSFLAAKSEPDCMQNSILIHD
jgi:hypothetical protein